MLPSFFARVKFYVLMLMLLSLAGCFNGGTRADNASEEWISLFNGKDLSDWTIKIAGEPLNGNYKNTFQVHDSMISIVYDQYKTFDDKYGHMYYKTPYSFYKLRYQYRFTGNQTPGGASWNVRNSGVMIHSQSAQSLDFNQSFPVSLEVQLLGGLGSGERNTGNVCTPGTQVHMNGKLSEDHCINSNSKTYDGDQWVSMTVIVLGDSVITHIVESDTVFIYDKPEVGGGYIGSIFWSSGNFADSAKWIAKANTPLKEGYIALQAESHPIDFRRIELLNLEGCMVKSAKNYKSYYIKANNQLCR